MKADNGFQENYSVVVASGIHSTSCLLLLKHRINGVSKSRRVGVA